MLTVQNLHVQYGDAVIVDGVSFRVEPGQWLMIIGPNGAGKSTIINAVSQGVPYDGTILFEGQNVRKLKSRELARSMGVLLQNHYVGYSFTVEEVVRLGRYAYAPAFFAGSADKDAGKVEKAIEKVGMQPFLKHSVLTLSGGELQRTFLAQLFAQDPMLLMLDEPTNHLDLIYQKQVFALIQDWIRDTDRAVISVVHDLSLAWRFGTHALLLEQGKTVAYGTMADVMTPRQLNTVYSMDVFEWMQKMYAQWTTDAPKAEA